MKVQLVTFSLSDLSDADFAAACEYEWASVVAAMPGLVSKTWLRDLAANSYGGVYVWEDESAARGYAASDFFRGLASDPRIRNLRSSLFDVMDGPTRLTNGLGIVAI